MHTSIVVVGVLRVFAFTKPQLKEQDIKIQTQRGSGPGGQHRNKTDSAVRMTHIPTGLQVFIDGRDQHQNKTKARQILESRVYEHYLEIEKAKHNQHKKSQMADGGRTGKIRTYNFKNSTVTNHITGNSNTRIKEIMKGNLDLIK